MSMERNIYMQEETYIIYNIIIESTCTLYMYKEWHCTVMWTLLLQTASQHGGCYMYVTHVHVLLNTCNS